MFPQVESPTIRWPFTYVTDSRYGDIGWVLVNGPIVTPAQQEQFARLRREHYRFGGMSSYMTFPRLDQTERLDYEAVCEVWCHCFRKPNQYLSTPIARALISESDFTDFLRISPARFELDTTDVRERFVYVGATETWKKIPKNWRLAARCVPLLCRRLHLRALVIGSPDDDFPPHADVEFAPLLPWKTLLARIANAQFLFLPNGLDASPRVITEALCLDVPLLVQRDILGGWKYVNRFTGAFFDDESNVVEAGYACCTRTLSPREWFCANYGPYLAGARLLSLLRSVDSALSERSYVRLDDGASEAFPAW